jgi:hypothetical protein
MRLTKGKNKFWFGYKKHANVDMGSGAGVFRIDRIQHKTIACVECSTAILKWGHKALKGNILPKTRFLRPGQDRKSKTKPFKRLLKKKMLEK